MRELVKLLSFVSLVAIQPCSSYAAVLSAEQPTRDASSTSGPDVPDTSKLGYPKALNQPNPNAAQQTTPTRPGPVAKGAPTLTLEQQKQLLQQAQNLPPEQLQAIVKSFNQQAQAAAPAGSEVTTSVTTTKTTGATPTTPVPQNSAAGVFTEQRRKSLDEIKRDQAFNMLMDDVLPLSPDQIKRLHKYYDLTLQAKATPPSAPPTPHVISKVIHLDPGSDTPVIRLAAGFITAVIFTDTTAAPWKLTAYSLGDPDSFNIQWDQKGNALFIQSKKPYAHGNLAVRLWGLDTPVMLTLVSGQKNVDFRVDLQVGERGPEAAPVVIDTTFDAKVNPVLMNILDGIPPMGSIKLGVLGGHGEAWLADNKVYFRTKLTVLSPAWVASVSSPDGTHVYELMITPYILATQNGKTVDIRLSGL